MEGRFGPFAEEQFVVIECGFVVVLIWPWRDSTTPCVFAITISSIGLLNKRVENMNMAQYFPSWDPFPHLMLVPEHLKEETS